MSKKTNNVDFGGKFGVMYPATNGNNEIIKINDFTTKSTIFSGAILNVLKINKVIYNNPATIVFWSDGTKTVSKCSLGDVYDAEKGLLLCCMKKLHGTETIRNTLMNWCPIWIEDEGWQEITIKDIRNYYKELEKDMVTCESCYVTPDDVLV